MKTVLLNVENNEVKVIELEDKLEAYYENLNCNTIDIVERKIGGKLFDIVCDDEGLLKDDAKISAISDMGEAMLVGNLIFVHNDGDIIHILSHIQTMYTRNHLEGYLMLTQCEYY